MNPLVSHRRAVVVNRLALWIGIAATILIAGLWLQSTASAPGFEPSFRVGRWKLTSDHGEVELWHVPPQPFGFTYVVHAELAEQCQWHAMGFGFDSPARSSGLQIVVPYLAMIAPASMRIAASAVIARRHAG